MSALTIESLGLTKDELAERLVRTLADDLLEEHGATHETLHEELRARVMERVTAAVEEIAGRNVLPNVASYVEGLCLQQTNKWGEKVGQPSTFVEYLIARAEAYLQEPVDFKGMAKNDPNAYQWKSSQTRVAHLIHEHLQYSIETAMKAALQHANSAIVIGLQEAVKIKLAEVAALLKVDVKTR